MISRLSRNINFKTARTGITQINMFQSKKTIAIKALANSLENLSKNRPELETCANQIEKTRNDLIIACGLFHQKWGEMVESLNYAERELKNVSQEIESAKTELLGLNHKIKAKMKTLSEIEEVNQEHEKQ